MAKPKHVEGVHDFEAAGLGVGPYKEVDVIEDPTLGLCCDACGQVGLRYKHIVESAEGNVFGVGSECIRKADPELWLQIKHERGIVGDNITAPQIQRKKVYDEIMVMLNDYNSRTKRSYGVNNFRAIQLNWRLDKFYRELKDFESVKKKQVRTLRKLKEEVSMCYGYWQRDMDRRLLS